MELAQETKNASAFAQASMNRAKLLGVVTDKIESRQTVQVLPGNLPPETIEGIWARIDDRAAPEPELLPSNSQSPDPSTAVTAPAKTPAPDPEPVLN
jgi:hypothetical protein